VKVAFAKWRKANREKASATQRKYQKAHPERLLAYRLANKEKIAATRRAYKQANRDKVRADTRKWFAANPGVVQRWRKANPEAFRAQTQTRHARMANAEGRHTAADLKALLKQQNGRCGYCRKSIKTTWTVDHIQALSRGGTNWISNIQLLCLSCNTSKQDADPLEFARRLGRLI
jgi:5-methylcytosine-specific restriction endonuclease McrA